MHSPSRFWISLNIQSRFCKLKSIFNPNSNLILNPDSTIQFLHNSFSAIGFRIFNFTHNLRTEKSPNRVLFIGFCNSFHKFMRIWATRSSILIWTFFLKVSIDMFRCKRMVNYWTILTTNLFTVLTIIDLFFLKNYASIYVQYWLMGVLWFWLKSSFWFC